VIKWEKSLIDAARIDLEKCHEEKDGDPKWVCDCCDE